MDGAACNIVPCLQCALMRVEALIFGEERWMNVEHPALPFAYEFRGEQAHVTGEGDIIGSCLATLGIDNRVEFGTLQAPGGEENGRASRRESRGEYGKDTEGAVT